MNTVSLKSKLHAKKQDHAISGNQLEILGLLRVRDVLAKNARKGMSKLFTHCKEGLTREERKGQGQ